jgi:hypothetical protein
MGAGQPWDPRKDKSIARNDTKAAEDIIVSMCSLHCTVVMGTRHFSLPGARETVRNVLQGVPTVVLLLIATILEVSGDAVVRTALYNHVGVARLGLFLAGTALLLGYGTFLNLAPLEFGQVVGLYLATLFVVWQVVNFVAFRALPTPPIAVGGSLIIAGGAVITFRRPG